MNGSFEGRVFDKQSFDTIRCNDIKRREGRDSCRKVACESLTRIICIVHNFKLFVS